MVLGTSPPSIISLTNLISEPILLVGGYVSKNFSVKSILPKFRTPEDPILDLESFGRPLGQVLAYGSFAILHFREMGPADPYENRSRD
jgi:hypothetical protein